MTTRRKQTDKLLSLSEAAALTPYDAEYLNLLVRRGKLPAKKIGRNWYTSENAIRWYLRRHHLGIRPSSVTYAELSSPNTEIHPSHQSGSLLRLTILLTALILLFVLLFPSVIFGMAHSTGSGSLQLAMDSPNYTINESYIGGGGRIDESSPNYTVLETIGDVGTGNSSSTNYRLEAGYLAATQDPRLTFAISTSSIDLGTLSTGAVNSVAHTMTALGTLTSGFVITALAPTPLQHEINPAQTVPFVADGTVDVAGADAEYGAEFTGGSGSHPGGDIGFASVTTVTTYTGSTSSGDTTTVTYKAVASNTTAAGGYTSTTTYVATATY